MAAITGSGRRAAGHSSRTGAPVEEDASPSTTATTRSSAATDKVLSISANLAQLLPTGSVLAYQSLSASFTNQQGECYASNRWLSVSLVAVLTASCVFFAFTDSIKYKGKVYYGVATPGRLNLFNLSRQEEGEWEPPFAAKLKKRGLRTLDWVHAFFSALVFLAVAASDVALQKCFLPSAGNNNAQQLLKNLPLGMGVLSSFVFMIFPTKRKGIGSHSQGSDGDDDDDSTAPVSRAADNRVHDVGSPI